jgi:hypothetical protein
MPLENAGIGAGNAGISKSSALRLSNEKNERECKRQADKQNGQRPVRKYRKAALTKVPKREATMAALEVTKKLHIYHTLYRLNLSFSNIVVHLFLDAEDRKQELRKKA